MADGTFPESIGFIMFVDPVEESLEKGCDAWKAIERLIRLSPVRTPVKSPSVSSFMNVNLIWLPRLLEMNSDWSGCISKVATWQQPAILISVGVVSIAVAPAGVGAGPQPGAPSWPSLGPSIWSSCI